MRIDMDNHRECITFVITLKVPAMTSLKLTRIGNSVGVVLPKDVLARLRLGEGDAVYLTESPDGYRLTPDDAEFERQMRAAETVMRTNRDVWRQRSEESRDGKERGSTGRAWWWQVKENK